MFVWVEGPETTRFDMVYQNAIRRRVAFVPGHYFFADHETGMNTMRLNFTMATVGEIDKAVRILGHLLRTQDPGASDLELRLVERQQNASCTGAEVF